MAENVAYPQLGTVKTKIGYPPSSLCRRKLKPGDVMRVPQTHYLVGYFLACPACRFIATYLDEDHKFKEEGDRYPRLLLGCEVDPSCMGCRRVLRISGGEIEAIAPS
jgi:hypothetical protein